MLQKTITLSNVHRSFYWIEPSHLVITAIDDRQILFIAYKMRRNKNGENRLR